MEILQSKIRSWSFPQLLLYTALLSLIRLIIIQLMYSVIIFLKKYLLEEWDKEGNVKVTVFATTSCLKRRL
jgi:hypothetical protein